MELNQIEQEINAIKERNVKVESEKAWEISLARKSFIALSTYAIAAVWLLVINDTNPLLKALVPAAGYILSTLSLPFVKQRWIDNHYANKKHG